jgi:hypothetical protein
MMAMVKERKSQSAVEYLMTYGWAIVAVAVALGILFSLGVFNLGSGSTSTCRVVVGFSCSKPVLFSSGVITMQFGQTGTTKTITATGCSSNSTTPKTWQGTSTILQSGQVANLTFSCPVSAGAKLGSVYSGTLWIQYTSSGGGGTTTQQIASISVPVTQISATFSAVTANIIHSLITNSITVAAPALSSSNLVICSAAEDPAGAYLGYTTSYASTNDNDNKAAWFGTQSGSGACVTTDDSTYQSFWAGAAVNVNTQGTTVTQLADSESNGNNGCGGQCQSMNLYVNVVTPMPVVIVVSCGYDGGCIGPYTYGSIANVPSSCTGSSATTSDGGSSATIYTCSVLGTGNYIITASSAPTFPTDMAMTAYGFKAKSS